MKYILGLSLVLLSSLHKVNGQDPAEFVELNDLEGKCVECIFSDPRNYYCPSLGKCIQSSIDQTKFTCNGEESWTDSVEKCTINTKCALSEDNKEDGDKTFTNA